MNWLQRVAARAFRLGTGLSGFETMYGNDAGRPPAALARYAATSPVVHACATLRARNLARLKLRLYRRAANGERVEVQAGRAVDLLKAVNPHWTFRRLLRMTEMSLCLQGQAFWVLEPGQGDGSRRVPPREAWWADPARMRVVPSPTDWLAGFDYDDGMTGVTRFRPDDVVWFRNDNPADQFGGLSPLAAARLAVDTADGAMRANRRIFDHGLQLAGIVGPADKTQSLTREQAEGLVQMLDRRFSGADKAHRMAVLTQPVSFTPLALTPKDAEFLGLMKWASREVCAAFGVPPELVGDHEHATYSNVEQAAKALWTDTLIPEATMIADEITEQLLPLFGGEADVAEFDLSEIETLQEDRGEIIDQAAKLVTMGVPLNRVLQEVAPRFLPPGNDGYPWGDVAWKPSGMVPVADASPPVPPSGAIAEGRAIEGRAIVEAVVREAVPTLPDTGIGYGSPRHVAIWRAFVARTDRGEARMKAALREHFRRQEQSVLARIGATARAVRAPNDTPLDFGFDDDPFGEEEWAARLKAAGQPVIADVVEEAGQATIDDLGIALAFDVLDPRVVNVIEGRSQRFARQVTETTYRALQASLSQGVQAGESIPELQRRVGEVMDDARSWRTEAIARTEVVGASNVAALEGARQSGVARSKTWLAALDDRTRETHVAAHRDQRNRGIPLDEEFWVGAERALTPHGEGLSSGEAVNCRCTLTFEV